MKRHTPFLLWIMGSGVFGLTVLLGGCSGEKAVLRTIEEYTPPPIYQAATAIDETAQGSPAILTTGEISAFEAQRERLEALKSNWEKSPAFSDPMEKPFFSPDDARVEGLSPAFTDDAAAANALADGFSLENLEVLVWGRNPKIKAAMETVRASLEGYTQAANLDDILRQYTAFTAASMPGVGGGADMAVIDKRFPFPGILALKGDIVSEAVRADREALEIARRTALTQAREIYWNLLYNRSATEIAGETLALLTGFEEASQKRFESGKAPLQELMKIRSQKETLKEEEVTLKEVGLNLKADLRALVFLPPSSGIGNPAPRKPHPSIPSLNDLTEMALTHRQELTKMNHMIRRMEGMIEMGETEVYPGFSMNFSLSDHPAVNQAGTARMAEPFSTGTSASMGSGVPRMPFTGLSEAYLVETRKRLVSLKEELKGLQAETVSNVRKAWFLVDQARRELRLYTEKLTYLSQLNFTVSATAYESGQIPFSEAMDTMQLRLNTRLGEEKRKEQLGVSIARLNEAVGGSWPEK